MLKGSLKIENDLKVTGAITTSAGVGIGTDDPGDYKLNVQGNQYINGDLAVKTGNKIKIGDTEIGEQEIKVLKKLYTNQLKVYIISN